MTHPIKNIDDVDFHDVSSHERFEAKFGFIGRTIGARKLGYNLTVVAPGKRGCPFHNHYANEEMFFVIEGEGEVRIGTATYPVRAGDVVACPTGGPETAHQFINTSPDSELKYLAVSTMIWPDLCEYPDSGKSGIFHEKVDADGRPSMLRYMLRKGEGDVDYWEGE